MNLPPNKKLLVILIVVAVLAGFLLWNWLKTDETIYLIFSVVASFASIISIIYMMFESSQLPSNASEIKKSRDNYYRVLRNQASQLDLTVIDDTFTQSSERVTLPKVYQDQYVREFSSKSQFLTKRENIEQEKAEHIPLLEAVTKPENKLLVILGIVGSGKSSFVEYLTWMIANSWLDDTADAIDAMLHRKPVVRIILRNVAVQIQGDKQSPYFLFKQEIERQLRESLGEADSAAFVEHFYSDLTENGIILLDGLDEVPKSDKRRSLVLEAIESFAQEVSSNTKIIVTSRPYAYENHQLDQFNVIELEPMNEEQIKDFVHHWYSIMPAKDTWQQSQEQQADDLSHVVLKTPHLKSLAETPLILTLVASLHYARNILPNSRAELYESFLMLVLERWHQKLTIFKENAPLEDYELKALSLKTPKLAKILGELALHVHKRQRSEILDDKEPSDISEIEIRGIFDKQLPNNGECRAENLLDFLQFRSGILAASEENHFKFIHRSFQEYLAARAIRAKPEWQTEIETLLNQDANWWREVFLLIVGRVAESGEGDAMSFLQRLVPDEPKLDWQLHEAARYQQILLAAQAGLEQHLQSKYQEYPSYGVLYENLRKWLDKLITWEDFVIKDRAKAGDLLGQLGDSPKRTGVTLNSNDQPEINIDWVSIIAGSFMMGEDKQAHKQTLPAYQISRYPITNAQFAVFIGTGGYENREFWSDKGWQWKQENNITLPHYWQQTPWNIKNHPVVGISWFEASAFTRWLNAQTNKGEVRIPTEREWEYAARGNNSLAYPWGNDCIEGYANTSELALKQTTAVGMFPKGKSPFGVEEMSGNVWEWTSSNWGKGWEKTDFPYPYDSEDGREAMDEGQLFVLRGGSWYISYGDARCADRFRDHPHNRGNGVGFRVLLSLASDF